MFAGSRKSIITLAAVGIAVAGAGVAIAQGLAPADAVTSRQQHLKDLGAAVKVVRDQMQTGSPDLAKIKTASVTVKSAADTIGTWFPAGSGPEAGVKTAAKPEIWSDAAAFTTATNNFVEKANKFVVDANSGNVAALGDSVKGLGQSCGGCHEKFRLKDG